MVLNNSVQSLEFNLANTIKKLSIPGENAIAFVKGNGELSDYETYDMLMSLSESYKVDTVTLHNQLNSLTERDSRDTNHILFKNKYRAIIIAKPDSVFDEKDKFLIDQYIMRGGRVLWLVDPVFASMDSLQISNSTIGISSMLNLDDLLFHYGIRLNTNLLMDISACPIPIKTGQIGNQPQFEFYPWYFFPVVTPMEKHPIVNNLNAVKFEFVSSLDTVESEGIKKTILLKTSQYTRVVNAPAMISLEILRKKPDEKQFPGPGRPVAALLEGNFTSLYAGRIPEEIQTDKGIGFLEKCQKPTKMIVVSDGDVIKNYFDRNKGIPYPCGYDRYTNETFGNKDFMLNAIDYLCDDSGLINIRSRELKLRLLDETRMKKDQLSLGLINMLGPILLISLFGWIQFWNRRRKYTHSHHTKLSG